MSKFFHEDNPLIKLLGYLFDLMMLNLLTLLCSLPVITIGASLTAMNYVLVHGIEEKQGDVIKPFFRAFRDSFMQATMIWVPLLGMVSLAGTYLITTDWTGDMAGLLPGVCLVILEFLFGIVFLYVFPLLARYQGTLVSTIQNAVLIGLSHIPQTGAMFSLLIVYLLLFRRYWLAMIAFVCLFGITIPGYLWMKLYLPVFRKIEGEPAD